VNLRHKNAFIGWSICCLFSRLLQLARQRDSPRRCADKQTLDALWNINTSACGGKNRIPRSLPRFTEERERDFCGIKCKGH